MNDQPDFLEDIPEAPTSPDSTLNDEQLKAGGLVKVNAFMRSRASASALRIQKHREKKEAEGIKQINVQADTETREAIKTIADRTKAGEPLKNVMASLAGIPDTTEKRLTAEESQLIAIGKLHLDKEQHSAEEKELLAIGRKIKALTGWKKTIARLLLRSE